MYTMKTCSQFKKNLGAKRPKNLVCLKKCKVFLFWRMHSDHKYINSARQFYSPLLVHNLKLNLLVCQAIKETQIYFNIYINSAGNLILWISRSITWLYLLYRFSECKLEKKQSRWSGGTVQTWVVKVGPARIFKPVV